MKTSESALEEFTADIILNYFTDQLQAGNSVIFESEIWKLLGREFPLGRKDQKFLIREYSDNVISLSDFRNKIN